MWMFNEHISYRYIILAIHHSFSVIIVFYAESSFYISLNIHSFWVYWCACNICPGFAGHGFLLCLVLVVSSNEEIMSVD